ncbi:MAG: prefoldin subunit beta [Candidatus Woesearchaeota archaeon]
MDPQLQEKINQIQLVQQNMQNLAAQRQQFHIQLTELESALKEISSSLKTYKIIGNIMVAQDKEKLHAELIEREEMTKVRIASIEKQEAKLREKVESLQQEIVAELDTKKPAPKKVKTAAKEE